VGRGFEMGISEGMTYGNDREELGQEGNKGTWWQRKMKDVENVMYE
jgi:hypothetical protein